MAGVTLSRQRPGQVRDAIFDFLKTSGEASVVQIRGAVASRLDGNLSDSSVRSYLRLNTPEVFTRTRRGRYRLSNGDQTPSLFGDSGEQSPELAFEYGGCRLYRGDCLRWLAAQPPNSIEAIVTDPPYGLVEYTEAQQRKLRTGRGGVWRIPPSFDGHRRSPLPRFTVLDEEDLRRLEEFFYNWAAQCVRVLFADVTVMPRSLWEPWLLFRKPLEGRVQDCLRTWKTGGLRRVSADKPFGDVITSHPTRPDERKLAPHPSLKPQSFLRKLVRAILPLGEGTVLDPFAGSGSTLAAADAVGYRSIGVELDGKYLEMAKAAMPKLRHYVPPR